MDKELKNKDLEEVSGGSIKVDIREAPMERVIKPVSEACHFRNRGTGACNLVRKGKLKQCSDCSNNHD